MGAPVFPPTMAPPQDQEEFLIDEELPTQPEHETPDTDEPELPADDYGPAITVRLAFVVGAGSAGDAWKRAHELIQSADSKGLRLLQGEVTDYSAGDEEA